MTRLDTAKFWLQGDLHENLNIDGDTYFTGALVQDASENENLTITRNEITILQIGISSRQNLNYRLWFFAKDDFAADSKIGHIDLNLPTSGVSDVIGATTYYMYDVTDCTFAYEDEDATTELHLQLENKSVAAKNAGATGRVYFKIVYGVNN